MVNVEMGVIDGKEDEGVVIVELDELDVAPTGGKL